MFFPNDYHVLVYWRQRERELEAKLEQARLVQEALAARERRRRCYDCLFLWLGRQLVAFGCRLQRRYSPIGFSSPQERAGSDTVFPAS